MNMPTSKSTIDKWEALANLLIDLTKTDKISWKEAANEGEFITSISDNIISLKETEITKDGTFVPIMKISILSNTGKIIDHFNDEDLPVGGEYFSKLGDLVADINRKLSGADGILEDILCELRNKA